MGAAGLFEQAVALDPKAEEGYFAYAKYLDQHMRDARDRQERLKAARAKAAGDSSQLSNSAALIDRLNGRAKWVAAAQPALLLPAVQ